MLITKRRPYSKPIALNNIPPLKTALALFAVYTIWGSTYLAITYAIETIPPFMMTSIRFLIAGGTLFSYMWLRGEPLPTRRQWRNAIITGTLLMGVGQGGVVFAEQWVASGLAALSMAAIPLWTALFNTIWERKPSSLEALGLGLGFLGVVILNMGSEMWANPLGAAVLILSAIGWSFGSIWSRRQDMPQGMMGSAAMMLTGSAVMAFLSISTGEHLSGTPALHSVMALVYLAVFGSMIAFSAYSYLLKNSQPIIATSYAYVNPVIAVLLGWVLASEKLTPQTFVAALFIVTAVIIITTKPGKKAKSQ